MKLSKAEEQLMDIIWKNKKIFFKEIIDNYPEPKPASTTVATLLKRMQDKNVIGYKLFGNSRQYYPLIKKEEYFSKGLKEIIQNYFNNSSLQFASFFTQNSNMTADELEDLKNIVEQELNKKKK
ncbi:BlaI/MecI/CopY family transcriptional regulator [Bacteroides helcogenes]|uniref:Transcriptional repressor, CopY family n=1 Tax=Bacteroides helcogenes (strain ATCC 35417 / DSM 20613 / JCM 6297 / CCUG 15421 / P 36-108) TaxID=693979 RepID=E6SPW0_BACT6|nr:BlaI/MecI/CopY family transcriptional regulator [Bacteroides helcogenes]ADV44939.1 transcriptional repressor, CopY family [Bacteroides helcogenes P 36-108]MDY5239795.1 BlaI/MecI/CopY family transcriptional regulator [Bacteroides helcogenes]